MKKKFLVTKITVNSLDPKVSYLTVVHSTPVEDALGTMMLEERYHVKVSNSSVKVDSEVELDISKYDVETRNTPFLDDRTKAVIFREIVWLLPKGSKKAA